MGLGVEVVAVGRRAVPAIAGRRAGDCDDGIAAVAVAVGIGEPLCCVYRVVIGDAVAVIVDAIAALVGVGGDVGVAVVAVPFLGDHAVVVVISASLAAAEQDKREQERGHRGGVYRTGGARCTPHAERSARNAAADLRSGEGGNIPLWGIDDR
ncbi:MAG: hypothetical protein ACI8S6_000663 [Myxococcota bacterium]